MDRGKRQGHRTRSGLPGHGGTSGFVFEDVDPPNSRETGHSFLGSKVFISGQVQHLVWPDLRDVNQFKLDRGHTVCMCPAHIHDVCNNVV